MSAQLKAIKTKDLRSAVLAMEGLSAGLTTLPLPLRWHRSLTRLMVKNAEGMHYKSWVLWPVMLPRSAGHCGKNFFKSFVAIMPGPLK
jgi:hypothetical protein